MRTGKGDKETEFCEDRELVTERQLCENRELVATGKILLVTERHNFKGDR